MKICIRDELKKEISFVGTAGNPFLSVEQYLDECPWGQDSTVKGRAPKFRRTLNNGTRTEPPKSQP